MLEAGTYKAKAKRALLGKASTGKEQVGVEFELLDGSGTTIWWYGFFTDKTFERTIESLRFCGWTGVDLTDLSGLGDSEVSIVVEQEEYPKDSGQWSAKVKWVNSGDGVGMKEQLAPAAAKSFAEQMKGRILALSAGKPAAKPNSSRKPPPSREPGSDDDVPEWAR